jgi:hypothetical protein
MGSRDLTNQTVIVRIKELLEKMTDHEGIKLNPDHGLIDPEFVERTDFELHGRKMNAFLKAQGGLTTLEEQPSLSDEAAYSMEDLTTQLKYRMELLGIQSTIVDSALVLLKSYSGTVRNVMGEISARLAKVDKEGEGEISH